VQITALMYGSNVIYTARPVYTVFATDRFEVISAVDIDMSKVTETSLQHHFFDQPKITYVHIADKVLAGNIAMAVMSGAQDVQYYPEYYRPFNQFIEQAFSRSLDIKTLLTTPRDEQLFQKFLQDIQIPINNLGFFPIMGRELQMLAVVNRNTGLIITALDISPYPY
jgi:hypothetical protein